MMQWKRILPAVGTLIICYTAASGNDWPQWRGPQRDGIWNETGVIQKFSTDTLVADWRVPIGSGYNGPAVANGRVYVMDYVSEPRPRERLLCFDAQTGKSLWTYAYECLYRGFGYPAGPRATPTVDDQRVYILGSMGHLHCLNAQTGTVIWRHDLDAIYQIRMPQWGIAAAPLVDQNRVFIQIGGRNHACVVAFDKQTGREQWHALDDDASYAAPIMIEQVGKKVLVVWTGDQVVGLNPQTGTIYWEYPFPHSQMVHNIATPVWYQDYLFVSAFFDGSLLLKLDSQKLKVEKIWRRMGPTERKTESLHCCMSTPILRDNYIYGIDSYGELRCLELVTGNRVWENTEVVPLARWANAHLIQKGELTWLFNEKGELIIAKLNSNGYDEISRALLIEPTTAQHNRGVTWAHPAFANKKVYIRNDVELRCVNLNADCGMRNAE